MGTLIIGNLNDVKPHLFLNCSNSSKIYIKIYNLENLNGRSVTTREGKSGLNVRARLNCIVG